MGLKHAIQTLVRRDASPAHETKAGPAAKSNNESFRSIRNFVYVFVHRNDSAAAEENDTEQEVLTHHDLRRFPGGYQIGEHCLDQIGGLHVVLQREAMAVLAHHKSRSQRMESTSQWLTACCFTTSMQSDMTRELGPRSLTLCNVPILVNCGDDDEPRPASQPDASVSAFRQGGKIKEKYLWETPEDEYELHEVGLRARDRKKPISW